MTCFEKSGGLNEKSTREVLTGLRIQLWRQLSLNERKSMDLTTTATNRISRDVLMFPAEYESENSPWFDDAAGTRKQGLVRGTSYGLK
jgi:hypothetical protein